MSTKNNSPFCAICERTAAQTELFPASLIRQPIADMICETGVDWTATSYICLDDLNRFRADYVEDSLTKERGELDELEQSVVDSLREHETLSENVNEDFAQHNSFGDRVADKVATFGGSWYFIFTFGSILLIWIVYNTISIFDKHFDPYPYILLNLILSCLAAIQAPVIMMSQNRQEAKDRLRSEHDYRVNLKAELEIRHLHSKLDLLLTHQWQRLLEIQQVQTDLLREIASAKQSQNLDVKPDHN